MDKCKLNLLSPVFYHLFLSPITPVFTSHLSPFFLHTPLFTPSSPLPTLLIHLPFSLSSLHSFLSPFSLRTSLFSPLSIPPPFTHSSSLFPLSLCTEITCKSDGFCPRTVITYYLAVMGIKGA